MKYVEERMGKKVKVHFEITEKQYAALKELKADEDIPMSVVVRRALQKYLTAVSNKG